MTARSARIAGNVRCVLTPTYRELFVAIAGCAGALTGLLFVALSVVPHRGHGSDRFVIQQVRAAAALLAFVNSLTITLFTLVPGTNVGYPAIALGVSGLLFTAAGIRSILTSKHARERWRYQAGLILLLLVIFGSELVNGISALSDPRSNGPIQGISYAVVASLIVGVARAWELVGDRDAGVLSSIAVLTGRQFQFGPVEVPDEPEIATGAVKPGIEPSLAKEMASAPADAEEGAG
jgi:hypothetical protein